MRSQVLEPPPDVGVGLPSPAGPVMGGGRLSGSVPLTGGTWLPMLLLIAVIAGGSYLRLAQLGEGALIPDELTMYFAAESLQRGEGPLLPSESEYRRGIDVTRLVALSTGLLGSTPTAFRLPSALFGSLALVLFAAMLWSVAGAWAAVWGTLLLAICPESILQSRQLRFYTYQQVFGLVALYGGWRVLARAGDPFALDRSARLRQLAWGCLAVLSLLMVVRVQIAALSILLGWGVCLAVGTMADLRTGGLRAWRTSAPAQFLVLVSLGFLLKAVLEPAWVKALLVNSQQVPFWARLAGSHPLGYYYWLSESFPLVVSLAPVIFLAVALRNLRLSVYLALWFGVPLLLHSFVFPWWGVRFVLLALPALYLAAGIAAAAAAGQLYRGVRNVLERRSGSARLGHRTALAAVAVAALAALATTPAFSSARKTLQTIPPSGWEAFTGILHSRPDLAEVPLGHSVNLDPLYYLQRLDFSVARSKLEYTVARPDGIGFMPALMPQGTLDLYTGRPVLTTPEAIRSRFADAGSVLIGVDLGFEWELEPSLLRTLEGEAQELCQGRCEKMRLYHWRF
jgi:hypothetical protein